MSQTNFKNYQSPFSWRYGSEQMRYIFSEENKFKTWRRIWVALAKAQHQQGLVSKEELADLIKHQNNLSLKRILEIEKETRHDVVAAIREYAEKAKIGGGKIHTGMTSMDVVDNTDALRVKQALKLIESKLTSTLKAFAGLAKKYAHLPCLGYTHLQPAEPTTVGYRFAFYAQDLLIDYHLLQFVQATIKAKGIKGAVGTQASFSGADKIEKTVMADLNLNYSLIANQVYTRKYDYLVLSLLAGISSSLAKFAGDLRHLQAASVGEWSEPFTATQVGSSAMPFKKNPISSENICSLARLVAKLPEIALQNATHSYLERTLDDSANKRLIIPQAFLGADQILTTTQNILSGIIINKSRIKHNLDKFAPFSATESLLMAAVKQGADRQKTHELLRKLSLKNAPMSKLLKTNPTLLKYLKAEKIASLLDVSRHTGTAPQRAIKLANKITNTIK